MSSTKPQRRFHVTQLFLTVLFPGVIAVLGIILLYTGIGTAPSLLPFLQWLPTSSLTTRFFLSARVTVNDARTGIKYRGLSAGTSGVENFRGIFYAEDTAGGNRFAPAVPYLAPPESTVDATSYGAWCPQAIAEVAPLPFASPIVNVSENCLSLSISRPAGTKPDDGLPVIVWIHGGGHALGSHADKLYKPDGLVRQAELAGMPVIVVGINYRVGIFGFAATKALKDAGHMNLGLRDQRTALEWVRDNIAAFGGDPSRVTALGHSVGAGDIALHLLSYGGKKGVPFQKAMMMSGASGLNVGFGSENYMERTASIAKELGCTKGNDAQSQDTIGCMQKLPMGAVVNASSAISKQSKPPFGEYYFNPSLDGDYIPDVPSKLLRQGMFAEGIPVLSSWMTNDGAWYAPPTVQDDSDVRGAITTWADGLSASTLTDLLSLYPVTEFKHMVFPEERVTAQYFRTAEILRDLLFVCPIIDFTWHYTRASPEGTAVAHLFETNATRFTPVYKTMGTPFWRAVHLSDVLYVFGNDIVEGGLDNSPTQQKLTAMVARRAAAFANSVSQGKVNGRVGTFQGSLPAYVKGGADELESEYPSEIVFELTNSSSNTVNMRLRRDKEDEGKQLEHPIPWRRLMERCEFINSPLVRDEINV